jgi:hypothetical protein
MENGNFSVCFQLGRPERILDSDFIGGKFFHQDSKNDPHACLRTVQADFSDYAD